MVKNSLFLLILIVFVAGCLNTTTTIITTTTTISKDAFIDKPLNEIFNESHIPGGWSLIGEIDDLSSSIDGFDSGISLDVRSGFENFTHQFGVIKFNSTTVANEYYNETYANPEDSILAANLNAECQSRVVDRNIAYRTRITCVKNNFVFDILADSPVRELSAGDGILIAKIISDNIVG